MAANKVARVQRNWANVEYDTLLKILMTLNIMDLISVAHVCSSWRVASCDSSLWKKLDLSRNTWSYEESPRRLMGIMKCALSLSRGNLSSLIFHFDVFTSNEHFIWASQRSRSLKRLVLPARNVMSENAFKTAIKNWKGLESLTVPCFRFRAEFIKAIGTHCKNFSELKMMYPFNRDFARAVAAYIPNLKVLSLQSIIVHKDALVYILDQMEHLEVLNISHCVLIDESQSRGYFLLKQLDQSILEQASRLKTFLFCHRESCSMCQRVIIHRGIVTWVADPQHHEIWRNDVVRSLAL